MPALTGLLKPCYIFAPRTLVRRIGMSFARPGHAIDTVRLPWRSVLEVNANESIGRELIRQNVFDIAVSETAWRLLKPGDVAVDVGANIGYMTSLFAARVGTQGRVESFEPHPRIFERLRRNVGNLGGNAPKANIVLHDCALGNRDGVAHLFEPSIFEINEGTSIVATDGLAASSPTGTSSFEIRMARLDTFVADRNVALLKVDVEGFEGEVLAGGECSLAQRRIQNIIYEAHDCERSPLHPLLCRYGYAIFSIGHDLFGLKVKPGCAAPQVDRSWESPSYLATLNPEKTVPALQRRGWQVLTGC